MITTHVLDTSRGRPAAGVEVSLHREDEGGWQLVGAGRTDADGRLRTLVAEGSALAAGRYRLTFATGGYFHRLGADTFFPEVQVVFTIEARQHYHVPLLLSPYGYSTYRGS